MTEEKKRGRGRPRKDGSPPVPKNPDCEPATKGYVKCITRTALYTHRHEVDTTCCGMKSFLVAVIFGLVWLFSSMAAGGSAYSIVDRAYLSQIAWVSGTIAFVLFVVTWDIGDGTGNREKTSAVEPEDIDPVLCKYKPPKCEPKKECE